MRSAFKHSLAIYFATISCFLPAQLVGVARSQLSMSPDIRLCNGRYVANEGSSTIAAECETAKRSSGAACAAAAKAEKPAFIASSLRKQPLVPESSRSEVSTLRMHVAIHSSHPAPITGFILSILSVPLGGWLAQACRPCSPLFPDSLASDFYVANFIESDLPTES